MKNKFITSLVGVTLVLVAMPLAVQAVTFPVVSDADVDVVGVYNKSGGPGNFVDLSGAPADAMIAAEPAPYPSTYTVGAMSSVWDVGTGLYFQNTNPGAEWIWDTARVEDAAGLVGPTNDPDASTNGRVVVFQKTFIIPGAPQDSVIHVAADNGWEVWVNGVYLARSASAKVPEWYMTDLHEESLGSSGWQTVGHVAIPAAMLQTGSNTIKVFAGNEYYDNTSPYEYNNANQPVLSGTRQYNPGAVIFKADISYEEMDLEVSKTAETSFTRTYDWTIDKTVDHPTLTLAAGQLFVVNYQVDVDSQYTDSEWMVTGAITVHNPNDTPMTVSTVVDEAGAVVADVVCPQTLPYELPGGADLVCTYSAALAGPEALVNTATVNGEFIGTDDVIFGDPTNEVDECVDVTDTQAGFLGTVCGDATFTYSKVIGPYLYPTTDIIENTASFVTNDDGTQGSDSQEVLVTVPETGCTLTQGYWKNHADLTKHYDDAWNLIGGTNTPFFLSGKTYLQVLQTPPSGGNAYYQLAHQYIAAKLNVLNGASQTADVISAMSQAETLFNTYTPAQIAALKGSSTLRKQFVTLAGVLGSYNEGLTGPGHCDEQNPVLVQTLTVPANSMTGVTSAVLANGKSYLIRVIGMANAGDTIDFDAKYSITNKIVGDTWTDDVSGYTSYGPTLLDLQIDGVSPLWGAYNPLHEYQIPYVGAGSALQFKIYDIYPSNNTGSLTVEIYEL